MIMGLLCDDDDEQTDSRFNSFMILSSLALASSVNKSGVKKTVVAVVIGSWKMGYCTS